jgi:hypothetical protein
LVLNFLTARILTVWGLSHHRTEVELVATPFHMPMVSVPVADMATRAARQIIDISNPYSTAVAALVDRNSLVILVIVLPPPKAIVLEPEAMT